MTAVPTLRPPAVVSVAVCTCDGERYVGEQLASIAGQSRPVDELVVCDDGSTDGTLSVVDSFAAAAPFPVRVYRTDRRLGPAANFARAVALCRGDTLFLADQDDVWAGHKVERMLAALADPRAAFAFSDAAVVDAALRPLGHTLWQAVGFTPADARRFAVEPGFAVGRLLRRYCVTGATLAFRAAYRPAVLPVPDGWMHDAWIALALSAVGVGVPVPEPLVAYRQHANQLIGGRWRGVGERGLRVIRAGNEPLRAAAARYRLAAARLTGMPEVAGKAAHLTARAAGRAAAGRWPRAWAVARELSTGRYPVYSAGGWATAALDLVAGLAGETSRPAAA